MTAVPAQLRNEWRARLKASGFVDIESSTHRDDIPVFINGGPSRRVARVDNYEDTAEYYRRAGLFLHEHKFTSALDRAVWTRHANGESYEDIAIATLTYKDLVHQTVARLRVVMLRRGKSGKAGKSDARALLRTLETMDAELLLLAIPVMVGR